MFSLIPTRRANIMACHRVVCLVLLLALSIQHALAQEVVLWPDGAPGLKHQKEEEAEDRRETSKPGGKP
jgi:hypothetical protein